MDKENKAVELNEKELAQVAGGSDDNMPFVTELTDELIASGNFLVPTPGFWYKDESYKFISTVGLMAMFVSSTEKRLFIPIANIYCPE